jgi:hypothetical protein
MDFAEVNIPQTKNGHVILRDYLKSQGISYIVITDKVFNRYFKYTKPDIPSDNPNYQKYFNSKLCYSIMLGRNFVWDEHVFIRDLIPPNESYPFEEIKRFSPEYLQPGPTIMIYKVN